MGNSFSIFLPIINLIYDYKYLSVQEEEEEKDFVHIEDKKPFAHSKHD
jgi:hypothetical protein